ncbi:hypothetical protein N0V90_006468 [Kalmusia sp. IMI 367209]|nr:hypothetical protein N0V90_006468 [Kalmusia sp. IMI 367209]
MAGGGDQPPNESRAHVLIGTAVAFFVLDICFVALRLWSRRIQRTRIRHDDVLVVATLIIITGTCITSIYSVKRGGVGRHLQYVPKHERIEWLKSVYIAAPSLYATSASLPKLAVISMYLKIFSDRISRMCCWAVVFILAAFPIVSVPIIACQCRPIEFLWNKSIAGGHCVNQAYMFRYGSIPNIVTDVVMLILPMPLVWNLHASNKVKLGLFVTFLLGSVGLITSILRFVAFFSPIVDGTWAAVNLLNWVIIEPSIYLLAACMLAFKPLLRYLVHESTLSRLIAKSWSGARPTRDGQTPYGQSSTTGGATRLPSEDGGSQRKILREREIYIEHSTNSTDGFGMHELPRV